MKRSKWDWIFSLEFPYGLATATIYTILFIIYLLVDGLTDSPDWPVILLTIIIYVYGWLIWFYQAYTAFTLSYHKLSAIILVVFLLLYYVTLLQNTVMYGMTTRLSPNSFVGIDPDISNFARIGLSAFLSIETLAALGTGAIFANKDVPYGFIGVALNSIQSVFLIATLIPFITAIVLEILEETKKSREKSTKKTINHYYTRKI